MPENDVKIVAWPSQAARLEHQFARETPLPICIEVCRPICAQSDYTIGIEIFTRPIAQITVRGLTRLFNCDEQAAHPTPATK